MLGTSDESVQVLYNSSLTTTLFFLPHKYGVAEEATEYVEVLCRCRMSIMSLLYYVLLRFLVDLNYLIGRVWKASMVCQS